MNGLTLPLIEIFDGNFDDPAAVTGTVDVRFLTAFVDDDDKDVEADGNGCSSASPPLLVTVDDALVFFDDFLSFFSALARADRDSILLNIKSTSSSDPFKITTSCSENGV